MKGFTNWLLRSLRYTLAEFSLQIFLIIAIVMGILAWLHFSNVYVGLGVLGALVVVGGYLYGLIGGADKGKSQKG